MVLINNAVSDNYDIYYTVSEDIENAGGTRYMPNKNMTFSIVSCPDPGVLQSSVSHHI